MEHEVTFEGVEKTREQHLAIALGTAIGIAKLVERARHGDAAEADSNTSCALSWARLLVTQLEGVPPADRNRTME
jgi:hypothetical protein